MADDDTESTPAPLGVSDAPIPAENGSADLDLPPHLMFEAASPRWRNGWG